MPTRSFLIALFCAIASPAVAQGTDAPWGNGTGSPSPWHSEGDDSSPYKGSTQEKDRKRIEAVQRAEEDELRQRAAAEAAARAKASAAGNTGTAASSFAPRAPAASAKADNCPGSVVPPNPQCARLTDSEAGRALGGGPNTCPEYQNNCGMNISVFHPTSGEGFEQNDLLVGETSHNCVHVPEGNYWLAVCPGGYFPVDVKTCRALTASAIGQYTCVPENSSIRGISRYTIWPESKF